MEADQKNNKILKLLFDQDQLERHPNRYHGNEVKVAENDAARRKRAGKMLSQGKIITARDHYRAAMIFQHGQEVQDYRVARELACKSSKMQNDYDAGWLCAVTTDRLLVAEGKKQKYGTQYQSVEEKLGQTGSAAWTMRLSPYDKRTSDRTRARYGVPPLAELIAQEVELTKQFFSN